jgi:flagellar biosynthesis protein FliQ
MDGDTFVRIASQALLLTLLISAVPVLTAMVVGLIVSVFQAATQLQELTLSSVPKIIAVSLVLALAGPWMIRQLVGFSVLLFERI